MGWIVSRFLSGGGLDSPVNNARSASAMILVFYLIPATVFYSATQVRRFDESRRCLGGHQISPLAKFLRRVWRASCAVKGEFDSLRRPLISCHASAYPARLTLLGRGQHHRGVTEK